MGLRNYGIAFFAIPITATALALIYEAAKGTFLEARQFGLIILIAIICMAIVTRVLKVPWVISGAVIVGVIMSPYMQFFVGQMNIFVVDPPEFRESVTVPEIRVQMGEVSLQNDKGEWIKVMDETEVHALSPGGNRINLGALNIPAGNYIGGRMNVMKMVEVDVEVDIEKEVEYVTPRVLEELPPVVREKIGPDDIREVLLGYFTSSVTSRFDFTGAGFAESFPIPSEYEEKLEITPEETITKRIPVTMNVKNVMIEGEKIKFTFDIGVGEQDFPMRFSYPVGRGGPDVLLDIELNKLGFPVNVQPILLLPPGAPEIKVPAKFPTMPPELMPPEEDFVPPRALGLSLI